ncbi:MAG: hypothetical protein ACYTAS_09645, partial [Planctomycetota bacterium]
MRDHYHRMKQASIGLVGLAAVLVLSTNSVGRASDEDFRYWAKATFLIPIREQWEFGFEQKFGFEDEARRLGHYMQDYGFVYTNVDGWLKLFGALKVVRASIDERDDWIREVRPHFNIALFSEHWGVDIVNRSRIE